MTSDEIKKVREAAEDMLIVSGDVYDDSQLSVAEFALSLVGTDGDEPITEEWLREWGGYCYDFIWRVKGITGVFYFDEDESTLVWQHIGNKTTAIHTRYQFRLLAEALGIKRKEKS